MNVGEFNRVLNQYGSARLQFVLPSGAAIPAHFHVTEVGRVDKSFIDCGGTHRAAASCLLQVWTASDTDHRLAPSKLAKITALAAPILQSDALPVEVEYGEEVASQYAIDHFESTFGTLRFVLTGKRTDCLAKDKCGVDGCDTSGCCEAPRIADHQPTVRTDCGCGPTC